MTTLANDWRLVFLGHWNWKWHQARSDYSTFEVGLRAARDAFLFDYIRHYDTTKHAVMLVVALRRLRRCLFTYLSPKNVSWCGIS